MQEVGCLTTSYVEGSERETYAMYNGQTGDAMLGEYTVHVRQQYSMAADWTVTATVDGEVVWTKHGSFTGDGLHPTDDYSNGDDSLSYTYAHPNDDDYPYDDDDTQGSLRRLSTFSDASSTLYQSRESEALTVTLLSYTGAVC